MRISSRLRDTIDKDPVIKTIRAAAARCGSTVHLVGGYLRDRLLGRDSRDYDFLLQGNPGKFLEAIAAALGGRPVRFRKGGITNHLLATADGRCDFVELEPGDDLTEELRRRDFTINTMAWNLRTGTFADPFEGMTDLREKRIRQVHSGSLRDDPLRILRGIRIACERQGFSLEEETFRSMTAESERLVRVAGERVREEIDRLWLSGKAARGLDWMRRTGALFCLWPEFRPMTELRQAEDQIVMDHTLLVVGNAEKWPRLGRVFSLEGCLEQEDLVVLLYAALFHDLGKPATFQTDPDGLIHFHGHEKDSRSQAEDILMRLRSPRARTERILRLVLHHLRVGWLTAGRPTERALRRVIRTLQGDLPFLLLHSLADRKGSPSRGRGEAIRHHRLCRELYELFREKGPSILDPPRLVSGEDVMRILGIPSGPRVGEILREVEELQLEGEIRNRRQALRHLGSQR
ncbi:MAG: HD domain-containing protein [Acidobacteriota bacterium]